MPDLYGTLKLRPTRIGFLVRPSDKKSLSRVFRLNSCLWGGAHNPIIPVCHRVPKAWRSSIRERMSGRELTDGYLEFFQPDVYVEATTGLGKNCGIDPDDGSFMEKRIVSLDDFVMREEGRIPQFYFGESMLDAYRKLFVEEFQFVTHHDRSLLLCDGDGHARSYFEIALGCFPEDDDLAYFRDGMVDAFKAKEEEPDSTQMLRLLNREVHRPLGFTKYKTDETFHQSYQPVVFIFDPRSALDQIDAWNIRHIHKNVFPVNVHWLDQCKEFLTDLISDHHRPLPGNRHGVMTHTTVEVARSIASKKMNEGVSDLLSGTPAGSWHYKEWFDPIWRRSTSRHMPRVRRANIESQEVDLELNVEGEADPTVRFATLAPDFADKYGGHSSRWVNVLNVQNYGNAGNWALTLPSTTKAKSYPGHHISEEILVTREGLVIRQRFKRSREYVRLVRGQEAVVQWLSDQSIKAGVSDAGRIAEQVARAVDGVWGAYLLKDRETLRLLNKMSKTRNVREMGGQQLIEEYEDRTASVADWQAIAARRENRRPQSIIDGFVKAGALKLGLQIPCTVCEKKNWYGITEITEKLRCDRCTSEYDFPQGSLDYRKTPWRFRIAGPFAVPNFAGGAYATVLTLRFLVSDLGSGSQSVTYSTSLDLEFGSRKAEVDFACWYKPERFPDDSGEPVFVVGEAKSFAQEAIEAKDVRRMKNLAQKLPGTVIVFAVLKDRFSPNEKTLLKALAMWGRKDLGNGQRRAPVVLLTGTELFGDFSLRHTWKELGGVREKLADSYHLQFSNLVELADATQQVNLGLPSFFESESSTRRAKKTKKKRRAPKKTSRKGA